MKFPVILCHHGILAIVYEEFFRLTGKLDVDADKLEIAISNRGQAGYHWMLDADGKYYKLQWKGLAKPTLAMRVGLRRHRENYGISKSSHITVGELRNILTHTSDDNPDLPHASDLKEMLNRYETTHVIMREFMKEYLGE